MNKNLFRICKILNWIIPVFWTSFLVYNGDMSDYAPYAVFFMMGYAAFAFFVINGTYTEVAGHISHSFLQVI